MVNLIGRTSFFGAEKIQLPTQKITQKITHTVLYPKCQIPIESDQFHMEIRIVYMWKTLHGIFGPYDGLI